MGLAVAAALLAGVLVAAPRPLAAVAAPARAAGGELLEAPDAASALAIARLRGERVEVVGARTETSSTWALLDGTMSTGQAAGPVWVRRGGDGTRSADWPRWI